MKSQKKILMLGGSAQQVPAILKAKELGYFTVLIDYLPDNPGQKEADKWYQESTTDIEAVYNIAKEEKVSGILPYASDPAALPAAVVCEKLGLPTNPAKSIEILGVKHKFREFLGKNGFACPRNYVFNTSSPIDEIECGISTLRFPIVIKPTDSSGSKGVSVINNAEGLPKAVEDAKTYSRNEIIIAEEFISRGFPDVIGGDIYVENGKIILFGDMACLRGDNGKSLIPIGEKKPNGLNELQINKLHSELQRLITALDIKNGEFNIEVIVDENDEIHFLEVGPRAGGNMIPIQLSDIFGIDLIKANVLTAMGEPADLAPIDPENCFMTYVLHSDRNGILSEIKYSREIEQYIYRKVNYKRPGEPVEFFDGAGKALGIVFLKFPSVELMNHFQSKLQDEIKVILN